MNRSTWNPRSERCFERASAAGSPVLPPLHLSLPRYNIPPRKVPVAMTADLQAISLPSARMARSTRSPAHPKDTTSPSTSVTPDSRRALRTYPAYDLKSHWTLGPHTAGPLLLFSILACTAEASAASAITPPSASISFTSVPFATPPIEGLQDNAPIEAILIVTSVVAAPHLTAARAASAPACPPPTTSTSHGFTFPRTSWPAPFRPPARWRPPCP